MKGVIIPAEIKYRLVTLRTTACIDDKGEPVSSTGILEDDLVTHFYMKDERRVLPIVIPTGAVTYQDTTHPDDVVYVEQPGGKIVTAPYRVLTDAHAIAMVTPKDRSTLVDQFNESVRDVALSMLRVTEGGK